MRSRAAALGVVATVLLAGAAHAAVRIDPVRSVEPGVHTAILTLYAAAEGGTALASESRVVVVDANGRFATPSVLTAGNEERWLTVRIPPGVEGRRVKLPKANGRPVTVHASAPAAILGDGFIESTVDGFRFPDGTEQTTAVSYGSPVTIGTSNTAGVATTLSRSDHVHAHGNQSGGTLHAGATTSVAGFLSAADKTKLDGTIAYVRTVIVSPTVGNATASGSALTAALAAITTASASDPYLLKIEPGVYDLGSGGLTMKSYVDIEGSGQNATFITSARSNASNAASSAVFVAASNSELRDLTVTNTGGGAHVSGYFIADKTNAKIRSVTFNISGGTTTSYGLDSVNTTTTNLLTAIDTTINVTGTTLNNGIFASTNANVVFRGGTSTVSGGTVNRGLLSNQSTAVVTIDSSSLIATGATGTLFGLNATNGKVTVYNSILIGEGTSSGVQYGVRTEGTATTIARIEHSSIRGSNFAVSRLSSSILRVATSLVDGLGEGSPDCIFTYDANHQSSLCQGQIL
jgi:hypothetical protein